MLKLLFMGKIWCDMLLFNTTIYKVDSLFSTAEAMAISDGKIIAIGTNEAVLNAYESTHKVDGKGAFLYPGFIDGHCHVAMLGEKAQQINLSTCKSEKEILKTIRIFLEKQQDVSFVRGYGLNLDILQKNTTFSNQFLDISFPNIPVILSTVDEHAGLLNTTAMQRANISVTSSENGVLKDVLFFKALSHFEPSVEDIKKQILVAQEICLKHGITGVTDMFVSKNAILAYENLVQEKKLRFSVAGYAPFDTFSVEKLKDGMYQASNFKLTGFKFFADGALGSRGAFLSAPYSDNFNTSGTYTLDEKQFRYAALFATEKKIQLATHAIGDFAVHRVLTLYSKYLKENNADRWRVEHCQIVSPIDVPTFKKYKIIPSVQAVHASSDLAWAQDRLGATRLKYAYPLKRLCVQNNLLVNGTDFPIDNISPLFNFFTSISRKNKDEKPFNPEDNLTRVEALKSITIWAAYAAFSEKEIGSLEVGKRANFVILDRDILNEKTTNAKIKQVYVQGVINN